MSSPGQAFGAVAGATIGFFIGGPTGAAYGFQIGLMAGSALFPTQLPTLQGPRIEDIASTTSQVGAPIPQGYGTFPAVGNIIWQSDLREVVTSDEVGGKGGSEQSVETATYYQDFAIGLNDGAIVGIRRIWANGKLIYDVSPQAAGESQEEYDARVTANLALDEIMTIYQGTETQLPDPTIETALGVGNISAFRGLAYVVFTGWQNKPEDGMRMPAAWKFELAAGELFATDLLYPWSTSVDPRDVRNQHKYRAQMQINTNTWGSIRTSLDAALADTPASFGVPRNTPLAWSCNAAYERSTSAVGPWMQSEVNEFNAVPDHHQLLNMVMWFNSREVTNQLDTLLEAAQVSDLADCAQHDAVGSSVGAENSTVWWIGFKQFDRLSGLEHGVYGKTLSGAHPADTTLLAEFCPPPPDDETVLFAVRDVAVIVERVPTPPPGYVLDTARDYHMLRKYAGCAFVTAAGRCAASFPLGPARPDDHPEFSDQTFWEAAYTAAVARGEMAEGLIYGTHYPQLQDYGYVVRGGEILPVSLAKIVRDICADTGLTDVDVSDLEDQYITGYVRTRVMPARAAIEPLSQVGFFDKIESGAVVRFPVRGKALVDTLLEDELGAHIAGSERPSAITTRKLQDVELPRQIRVHYLANSRDYEPGEQSSPVRTGTEAINEIDIELAVC
ncbi:MAG: hypothetical protein H0W33_02625, partial [Gammaproteobacteria bacterium]|nr:hypothetical protein [Gammaproteobacteria bacterium]